MGFWNLSGGLIGAGLVALVTLYPRPCEASPPDMEVLFEERSVTISESGRGVSTSAETSKSSDQNSRVPRICASGSRARMQIRFS